MLNAQEHFSEIKHNLEEVFFMIGKQKEFLEFQEKISFNTYTKKFYIESNKSKDNKVDYEVDLNKIYCALFSCDLDTDSNKNLPLSLNSEREFFKFRFILNYEYCLEISRGYITSQHIGPILGRAASKIEDLEKIFTINKNKNCITKYISNISIISLGDLNTSMKKLVPMIICKTKYEKKKKKRGNSTIKSSLHLIIDEAHNILSYMSTKESDVWKDYRLECFEEIIKEGRKFGTFLTIASQRPSDISDTIISQLHNYFIHRLVNEEDLRKIYKSVAFADKVSNELIPVLPAGGCLFSGISTNFPILAKIDKLSDKQAPNSKNVDLFAIWS